MKRNIFKKAHELTKKIIKLGDNYKATFKLCLSFLYSQIKKGVNKMVELKGSEKQIKWAKDIRANVISTLEKALEMQLEKSDSKGDRKGKTTQEWRETFIERYHKHFDELLNNDNAEYWINNFQLRKEDGFFLDRTLRELGIGQKSTLSHYLQKMK